MKKTFLTIDDMWKGMLEDVFVYGGMDGADHDAGGNTVEFIGWSGTLKKPYENFLLNPVRKLSPYYACGELMWYLTFNGRVDRITPYAPSYARFAEADGKAFGAYGTRMKGDREFKKQLMHGWHFHGPLDYGDYASPDNQLEAAISLLQKRESTRQCVISLWRNSDLLHAYWKDKKDLPCTLSLQFLVRNDALHLIVTMRSNDVWLGAPYDIFCFTSIQILVAQALGLRVGTYTHNVGSLHCYAKDHERANHALNTVVDDTFCMPEGQRVQDSYENEHKHISEPLRIRIKNMVWLIEEARIKRIDVTQLCVPEKRSYLADMAVTCLGKLVPEFSAVDKVHHPRIAHALKTWG